MKFWSTNEQYVYEERLGILEVIGRDPTPQEHRMALEDVERFRRKRSDKPARGSVSDQKII